MTKAKFLSFFVIFLIGIMFVSSIFAVLPLVKADADSQNTTGVGLNGVDNNQGTYCYLNGYDVFVLDDTIQFYSGNGSYLAKSIGTTPNGVMEKERVLVFNSTAIIVVMLGQTTDAVARLDAWIINTVGWNNITFGLTVTTNGENNGVWSTYSSDFVFAFINNVYYVYISAVYTYNSNYAYYSSIVQVNTSGSGSFVSLGNFNTDTGFVLGGESFWFNSATSLNVMYIITKRVDYTYFQIIKVDCVAPSVSLIGYSNQDYSTFVYFVNYNYDTIGSNSYYDVLFSYPASSDSTKMDVELIRFNDTYYQTPVNLVVTDTNSISNYMRPYGCIPPIWINSIDSLTDGNYIFLYGGYLYRIYGANVTLSGLDTVSPSLTLNSVPDGIINTPLFSYTGVLGLTVVFGYNQKISFAGGWWNNANINIFSTSNNLGGILSPFGYGNMLQIDYEYSTVCADYFYSTNPSNGLALFFSPPAYNAQKLMVLPSTTDSFTLSQNVSYNVGATLTNNGVIGGNGNVTIYSNGESQTSPLGNPIYNIYILSGTVTNGIFNFNVNLINNMQIAPLYESYLITTNLGAGNSTYILSFTWQFIDAQGNPLPNGDNGKSSGSGTGGGNGTGGTSPPVNFLGFNINPTYLAMAIYAICILGMCYIFFLMHSTNVPWAFALGLILATIICNIVNVLGIYTYPIDAMLILAVIGILVLGRH